ncbi:HAMP domain-containing sensor histidine kinase [Streptococcus salivarius]|uniref:Signal transduction histidine-protein kinase ArlS n=1 Tax=Streptococcus salivarius TaxID=1304 RepID=A0AA45CUA7_STRSL|nr:HAMP domain-containing histidine kinase [Streptococcus salivarius]PZD56888.1 two-component sensor histidine kinase [Streptococcus salivarius]
MSKLQDKLFGKVTIRKKLTMTTAVVFFLVLSMFTLVVVFSANTLLLQRERQNVNNTISKVVTYIEKDWDSDEELSPEPLLAALYSPKNIYASIINGVLSEKHSLDGQVAISNKLFFNQSVFVYDKKGTFIFTSEENTDSPPGMSEVNKLKSVSYKGKRGFLLQVPIYGKDKKTIVGYAQIFHDLEFYYALKERLIFLLIFLEVGMTVLVIAATVVVLTSILRPMRQLHETMGVITDSPSDLELRSKIESHDEIGDLAVNFNRMMDKIQENNQMQMRFLSDVSHELRTPIAVIKGHMDLLQRWGKNDPEILEESLEAASHEANRMTIMINDMLDSIRVKGSFENHRNDTCDLNSSIRTVIGNFRVLHEDYQFYLNDFESSERPAQIYSQHFEQAITILIDNAVKYSPVNKEIQVTIKALEDEMLVQVQDNGEGISKEDIEHIFERFYRSDKARNRTTTQSGVGIGLSILYQIVEAYRCRIDVSSELGVGTRFDLYIPFADGETTTPQLEL